MLTLSRSTRRTRARVGQTRGAIYAEASGCFLYLFDDRYGFFASPRRSIKSAPSLSLGFIRLPKLAHSDAASYDISVKVDIGAVV
jgi:hypothetical protein